MLCPSYHLCKALFLRVQELLCLTFKLLRPSSLSSVRESMDLSEQEEDSLISDSTLNGIPLLSMACKEDSSHICKRVVAAAVRYRECLKNHAASFGGNATDGCGEFMPCGVGDPLVALKCSVCGCHRNFHRKEVEGELPSSSSYSFDHYLQLHSFIMPRPVAMAPPLLLPSEMLGRSSTTTPEDRKKRLRTKFTAEQKEKMAGFAEKVGWKLQRQDESVLQFCEEIGVKRRVLKVWMHNNKHNFAQKNSTITKIE